jgi:hypothetical protein
LIGWSSPLFATTVARARRRAKWAAELYRQLGYGDYLRDGDKHMQATVDTLCRMLGPERVRVGKDGFDPVYRELGVGEQAPLF